MATLRNVYTSILQPRNAFLVILGDPPILPRRANFCLLHPPNCYASTTNTDANQHLAPLASEFTGVAYVEIFHLFCDGTQCVPQVPGTTTFAFFDNSHLTAAGGLYLWPFLCSAFESAGFM